MKYIGTILYGIIEIVILLIIVNLTNSPADSLIITLVILTYITVRGIGIGLGYTFVIVILGIDAEFKKLRKILNPVQIDIENSSSIEEIELVKKISKNKTKYYIELVVISILYIITILKLLGLLFS